MLRGEIRPLPGQKLTRRQLSMLPYIAACLSTKDIAKAIGLTPETVKVYVSIMLKKLRLDNRYQLAEWWKKRKAPASPEALRFYL